MEHKTVSCYLKIIKVCLLHHGTDLNVTNEYAGRVRRSNF